MMDADADAEVTEAEPMGGHDVAFVVQNEFESVPNDESDEHLIWYEWLVDSGTTSHIMKIRTALMNYVPLKSRHVTGIGNESLDAIGQGTVELVNFIGKKEVHFTLKNVLYVPHATNNLVSLSRLDKEGGHTKIGKGEISLFHKDGYQFAKGSLKKGLYVLNARAKLHPLANINAVRDQKSESWTDLHRRYGHVAYSGLKRLYREKLVDGINIDENSPMPDCEACIQAKQTRDPFPRVSDNRSRITGELTHSDVWGPSRTQSIGGSRYFISFIDDCSCKCTVEFMKQKSQTAEKVKQHITYLKNRWEKHPKKIHVDNGTGYINNDLITWCKNQGIELETTAPYSPEQNGAPERLNHTLTELARAMLIAKNLPEFLWAEAVSHAAYVYQESHHNSSIRGCDS